MSNSIKDPRVEELNGGLSVIYQNRSLYSKYNPQKRVEQLVSAADIKANVLYLIPSPLLGYGIESLLNKLPQGNQILFVELEPELQHLTSDYLGKFHQIPSILNLKQKDDQSLKSLLNTLDLSKYRRCEIIPLNSGYQLNKNDYDNIRDTLSHEIALFWQNRMTTIHMGPLWIKNLLRNHSIPGLPLQKLKTDLPVFIAGAGESLEESIPFLKKNKDKLKILAVDTALPFLLKCNIKPDFILIVESQWVNTLDFYYGFPEEIPVICDRTSYSKLLRNRKGPIYFFSTAFDQLESLKRLLPENNTSLPSLGCVGNYGVFIAQLISSGPYFFAGLDFGFDPAKPHCRGSASQDYFHLQAYRTSPPHSYNHTMNRGGFFSKGKTKPIYTTMVMKNYAQTFRVLMENLEIYDLGTTGLPLGIPAITPQTELKPTDLKKAQIQTKANNDTGSAAKDILSDEKARLQHIRKELEFFLNTSNADNKSLWTSFKDLLKETDYLYFHFPDLDQHKTPKNNQSFLTRCLMSCNFYMKIINQILSEQ